MGLAQRKDKQRIGLDPRNLTWSDDKSRFAYQRLKSLGWSDDQGLGSSGDGNPNHIAVARKSDNSGIGVARARKEGDELGGQAGAGLNDVLRRLAAASASASSLEGTPVPEPAQAEVDLAAKAKRNKVASRQRHLASKRMASSDPAALAAILGISVSELPSASPTPTTTPAPGSPSPAPSDPTPTADTASPQRDAEHLVSTSTLSVADYFRQKLRARALARQAAGGEAAPLPEALALVSAAQEPAKEWEGSRVTFDEKEAALETLGGYELVAPEETAPVPTEPEREPEAGPSTDGDERESKKARKAEKEARRAEKEAKRARKADKEAEAKKAVCGGVLDTVPDVQAAPAAAVLNDDAAASADKAARKAARKAAKAAEMGAEGAEVSGKKDKKRKRDKGA